MDPGCKKCCVKSPTASIEFQTNVHVPGQEHMRSFLRAKLSDISSYSNRVTDDPDSRSPSSTGIVDRVSFRQSVHRCSTLLATIIRRVDDDVLSAVAWKRFKPPVPVNHGTSR